MQSKQNSIQRQLMRPTMAKVKAKPADHRACLRNAGLAIANVILDSRIPLPMVKRDLEDLREAIDFAISVCNVGGKKLAAESESLH